MKYIINQAIVFDTRSGVLSLQSDEQVTVPLSRPGVRLLTALVTHCGTTLSRDTLLNSVWEEHGLTPSSNNLSNHISFLRKNFSQLGIEGNIIITVPREGFRLQAEVEQKGQQGQDRTGADNIHEPPLLQKKSGAGQGFITKVTGKIKSLTRLRSCITTERLSRTLIILIIIMLLALLVVKSPLIFRVLTASDMQQNAIGLCKIMAFGTEKSHFSKEKISIIKNIINDKNINCINQKSLLYFSITHFTNGKEHSQQAVFLTQCFAGQRENASECESYFSLKIKRP